MWVVNKALASLLQYRLRKYGRPVHEGPSLGDRGLTARERRLQQDELALACRKGRIDVGIKQKKIPLLTKSAVGFLMMHTASPSSGRGRRVGLFKVVKELGLALQGRLALSSISILKSMKALQMPRRFSMCSSEATRRILLP
jgi:hypothetical protein